MRRILVPLDGSSLSESIIPDAIQLAGPGGEIVLVSDVLNSAYDPNTHAWGERFAIAQASAYLERQAEKVRQQKISARAETLVITNTAIAIDDAARIFDADMIVCATHGRGMFRRLIRGGTAWRAVANSTVPILLRHVEPGEEPAPAVSPRLLVPLDGSEYAERALPLAVELARDLDAEVYLLQVVPDVALPGTLYSSGRYFLSVPELKEELRNTNEYLEAVGAKLAIPSRAIAVTGDVLDRLVHTIDDQNITHVVMASHGRTGLSRVILGSVADALIQKVSCPVILVPALVTAATLTRTPEEPAVTTS